MPGGILRAHIGPGDPERYRTSRLSDRLRSPFGTTTGGNGALNTKSTFQGEKRIHWEFRMWVFYRHIAQDQGATGEAGGPPPEVASTMPQMVKPTPAPIPR